MGVPASAACCLAEACMKVGEFLTSIICIVAMVVHWWCIGGALVVHWGCIGG